MPAGSLSGVEGTLKKGYTTSNRLFRVANNNIHIKYIPHSIPTDLVVLVRAFEKNFLN